MIAIEFTYEELDALITELEQPTTRPYDATIAEIVDRLEQKKLAVDPKPTMIDEMSKLVIPCIQCGKTNTVFDWITAYPEVTIARATCNDCPCHFDVQVTDDDLLFCEVDYHAGNHYTGVVWRVVDGKWEKKIAAEEASHE
jgi:hypothetical protein